MKILNYLKAIAVIFLLSAVFASCEEPLRAFISREEELEKRNIEYGMQLYRRTVLRYCDDEKIYLDFDKIDSAYWSACKNFVTESDSQN